MGKQYSDEDQKGPGVTLGRGGSITSMSAPSAPSMPDAGNTDASGQSQSKDRDACGWNG